MSPKFTPGDTTTTPSGRTVKILAIEPNTSGGPEFVYKLRSGREVWRVYTTTVDGYEKGTR